VEFTLPHARLGCRSTQYRAGEISRGSTAGYGDQNRPVSIEIRLLRPDERSVLDRVAPDVFDHAIDPGWSAEFFADPRHHLAVALDGGVVVAFTSAVHYVHPDKPPELWINEVGVAPSHQRQGLGRRLVETLLQHGATLGCVQAWVLTSPTNAAAQQLYTAVGGRVEAEPSLLFEFSLSATPGPGAKDYGLRRHVE
jgi:ribosomal protein S18 acetylase RimI-like enzyme